MSREQFFPKPPLSYLSLPPGRQAYILPSITWSSVRKVHRQRFVSVPHSLLKPSQKWGPLTQEKKKMSLLLCSLGWSWIVCWIRDRYGNHLWLHSLIFQNPQCVSIIFIKSDEEDYSFQTVHLWKEFHICSLGCLRIASFFCPTIQRYFICLGVRYDYYTLQ